MPETVCPHCGYLIKGHDAPGNPGAKPYPGAAAICWRCHKVSVFTETLDLRVATPEEFIVIAASEQYQAVLKARAAAGDSLLDTLTLAWRDLGSPAPAFGLSRAQRRAARRRRA